MHVPTGDADPCDYGLQYTTLQSVTESPPTLPSQWEATAVLHPFSPPPSGEQPDVPFFQLCTATFSFFEGNNLLARVDGCEYGSWWYSINESETAVSTDQGGTWTDVDYGWTLPTTNWFGDKLSEAVCAGRSYLNWMQAQIVDWWKIPAPGTPPATTWMWFDSDTGLPFRLMFGYPPPQPVMGDPAQLALFQMFSFTYFTSFTAGPAGVSRSVFQPADIPGFACGNPRGWELVEWNPNFGMTTLMTPVDAASNPLPTRVLYRWASDAEYTALTDRAQHTLMWYGANPASGLVNEAALMFGVAPSGVTPPPHSGSSFLIDQHDDGSVTCQSMPLGEEPPWWASIPAVDGAIHACISDNAALCPGNDVAVIGVLFPPSDEYPQGRYLWTWYSPFPDSNGSHARPVTFMESASTIAEGGTSLALADYFDYIELTQPIDAGCFAIPSACESADG